MRILVINKIILTIKFLLVAVLLLETEFSIATQCKFVFIPSRYSQFYQGKSKVTETEIFEQATKLALENLPSDKTQSWFSRKVHDFLQSLKSDSTLTKELMIELERRNLDKVADLMGLDVRTDLRTRLRNNSNSINLIFSALINGLYSFSTSFATTGIPIISLPEVRSFKLSKLTDNEIQSLLDLKMNGDKEMTKIGENKFKEWFITRYNINFNYNRYFRAIFHAAILIYILIIQLETLLNPEKVIEEVIDSMGDQTYNRNLETIKLAQSKLAYYQNNPSDPRAAEAISHFSLLIRDVSEDNNKILQAKQQRQ